MARSSHYSGQLLVLRWELLVICWLSALALELLFALLLRCRDAAVYGAAVYNSPTRGSGVLENALLLRCRDAAVYGAALLQMVCAAGYLLVISASVSWDHDSGHVLAILY